MKYNTVKRGDDKADNYAAKYNGTVFTIPGELDIFYESMKNIDLLYSLGIATDVNYRRVFDQHLNDLTSAMDRKLTKVMGERNGYVDLSVSGARGSKDNLVQAFAYKGRVKKNSTESFDALLPNCYASQLTPLEAFVAAYGGRQGQIDKSLKTGDTGYASRQMWHATQGLSIVTEDCGTSNGITLSVRDLLIFSDANTEEDAMADARDLFAYAITGRYLSNEDKLITEEMAKEMVQVPNVRVKIRSPLTCENPCCAKCFGVDWSTRKKVVVGTNVGIVSAQSIGEPGTQLTLKQFQKGGVAGGNEVTSAFDKVNDYIHVANLKQKWAAGKYPAYDPVAWASGPVKLEAASQPGMSRLKIGNSRNSIIVPSNATFRDQAVKGEGLAFKHGDCDLNELIKYADIYTAQRYLVFKLYMLYKSEVKIRPIHFEVLVSCMTRYMVLESNDPHLLVGQLCTRQDYLKYGKNCRVTPRLIGVKKLPESSLDAADAFIMESQGEGLSRVCLLGLSDSLTKPINRMVMGLSIINGSTDPSFITQRKVKV